MKRTFAALGFTLGVLFTTPFVALSERLGASGVRQSSRASGDREAEQKILAVLDKMVKSHQTYLGVPAQDGKALRLLTEATDAKNVVESAHPRAIRVCGFVWDCKGQMAG